VDISMTPVPSIKQAARKAHEAFGSDANTQLATVLIFVIVGLIVSTKFVMQADDEKDSFHCSHQDWLIGAPSCGSEPAS
jgi:hypothetical protein